MEMNTLVVLFQKKSLQALFNDKVKCLVEELLHVDESGRLVVILLHVAITTVTVWSTLVYPVGVNLCCIVATETVWSTLVYLMIFELNGSTGC